MQPTEPVFTIEDARRMERDIDAMWRMAEDLKRDMSAEELEAVVGKAIESTLTSPGSGAQNREAG